MKHIIMSLNLFLSCFLLSVIGYGHTTNSDKADVAFRKIFPGAECVRWSVEGDYHKATFLFYGKGAQALFDADGTLIGSVRNLLYSDLPIKVLMSIKNRFNNATPYAMTEINRRDGTRYRVFVDVGKKRFEAFVSSDGTFSTVKSY
jgi:hypothetical protein